MSIFPIEKRKGKWHVLTSAGVSMYSHSRKVFCVEFRAALLPVELTK